MRTDGNHGAHARLRAEQLRRMAGAADFREPPLSIEGAADHWNHREDADYYSQPGASSSA
jgi:catalase